MTPEQIQKAVEEIFNAYKQVDIEYDMGFLEVGEAQRRVKEKIKTILDQHTKNTWKAALDTVLESGLLYKQVNLFRCISLEAKCDGHNQAVKAIREFITKIK